MCVCGGGDGGGGMGRSRLGAPTVPAAHQGWGSSREEAPYVQACGEVCGSLAGGSQRVVRALAGQASRHSPCLPLLTPPHALGD